MHYSLTSVSGWQKTIDRLSRKHSTNVRLPDANHILDALQKIYLANIFSDRITALNNLRIQCNQLIAKLNDRAYPEYVAALINLEAKTTSILKVIFGVHTTDELNLQLNEHKKLQQEHKIYSQNFNLNRNPLSKQVGYKNEDKNGVVYLNELQREKYRIFLADGKFNRFNLDGQGDDQTLEIVPFSTKHLLKFGESKNALLVVDQAANMYALSGQFGKYHHSSVVSGDPVFFAGEIGTDRHGNLKYLSNGSGHYRPPVKRAFACMKFLAACGALASCTHFTFLGDHAASNEDPKRVIEKIQSDINANGRIQSTVMSYATWMKKSKAGFFNVRYTEIKNIDEKIFQYFKESVALSPYQNLQLIGQLLRLIETQKRTHPNSKRAQLVNELHDELVADQRKWQSVHDATPRNKL